MTAAALLVAAGAEGVTLTLDPAGKLKAAGKPAAVARWLPEIRAHKPALLALLTAPRRLWLVTLPGGERLSVSFCPPAGMAEVRAAYPTARGIEPDLRRPEPPIPEPNPAQETAVRCWLERIGETDAAIVAETIKRIRTDSRAFAYFLARALEPAEPQRLESTA